MARPDKEAAVGTLTDRFRDSAALLLTEYRGLSVTQLQELRRALGKTANYAVVKNKLARIAARNAGVDIADDVFTGPTAIAFVTGEPVEAAKTLRNFGRDNENLVIKGGVLEGSYLDDTAVKQLASLESREVLLGKAAVAMKAAMYQAAFVFNAPVTEAARTIEALREKQAADAA